MCNVLFFLAQDTSDSIKKDVYGIVRHGGQRGIWCTKVYFLAQWYTHAPEDVHRDTHTHKRKRADGRYQVLYIHASLSYSVFIYATSCIYKLRPWLVDF